MGANKKTATNKNIDSTIEDSKKVELYINNRDNGNVEDGISMMNVFGFMKKRIPIYAWLMVIGLLGGVLIPFGLNQFNKKTESAVAVVAYNRDEYSRESEVSEVKSSYVIQKALKNSGLSDLLSVSDVQSNISITGILTEDTQQQLEIVNTLVEKDPANLLKLDDITLKYKDEFIINLNNRFGEKGNIILDNDDLSHLLQNIMSSYGDYFVEHYVDVSLPNDRLESMNIDKMDYLDILDNVGSYLNELKSYCDSKSAKVPGFRASDGMSFKDLSNIIGNLSTSTLGLVHSFIYLNGISKDATEQLTNYNYRLKETNLELTQTQNNIKTIQDSIEAYKQEQVVISSTDGSASQTATVTSSYYNELVAKLTALNEKKTTLEMEILKLSDKIAQLSSSSYSVSELNQADESMAKALKDAKDMYNIVKNNTEELIESSSYKSAYLDIIQTTNNTETDFKTYLIGAGAGIGIALVIWVIDGFILEVRQSNKLSAKKEENR